MKKVLFSVLTLALYSITSCGQNPVNWTQKQLMEPATLAKSIASKKELPVIICIGPGATIPNSVDVGMINNEAGIMKLKRRLASYSPATRVVVYCGCCPFERCPNVRPAATLLKDMKFTNYFLLNLPNNIRKDWIDKGYPIINN